MRTAATMDATAHAGQQATCHFSATTCRAWSSARHSGRSRNAAPKIFLRCVEFAHRPEPRIELHVENERWAETCFTARRQQQGGIGHGCLARLELDHHRIRTPRRRPTGRVHVGRTRVSDHRRVFAGRILLALDALRRRSRVQMAWRCGKRECHGLSGALSDIPVELMRFRHSSTPRSKGPKTRSLRELQP